ncbi:MAG TPA: hypothetical protein VLC98_07765 [Phnomibacter sp.]|nr:hypothetical protein [Phnomibacter sp.]
MKTIITSLMALTLSSGAVFASNYPVTEKKTNATVTNVSSTRDSFQSMLEENMRLKEQVETLANQNAEIQSTLEYNQTMNGLLNKLQSDATAEQHAEIDALLAYHKTMAAVQQSLLKAR